MKNGISIKEMQFYWRLKGRRDAKNIVPDFLPFELDYDNTFELFTQKRNKTILKSLDSIYQEAPNIGNIQENSLWSNSYMNDFLRFIRKQLVYVTPKGKVLEVGCGGCMVLKELKKSGYDVLGIDPSPFSLICGKEMGVPVVRGFFPSPKIKGKFDLIFHSDVVEHVEQPLHFLKTIYNQLNDKGVLVIAIPDSEPNLKNGDISIFLHQHLSYFDTHSLRKMVKAAGFASIVIEKALYGGSLYCRAIKNNKTVGNERKGKRVENAKYRIFVRKAIRLAEKIKKDIDTHAQNGNESVGFYAPVRVLPYLGLWKMKSGFRFFDDTAHWHRKYFDGLDVSIENFEDLKKNPVSHLYIMSPTFGAIIEKRIQSQFGNKIRVKKLTDFFHT